jgi:hypothetical protein
MKNLFSSLILTMSCSALAATPPRFLVINVEGGWDPTMVFDYKGDHTSIDTDGGTLLSASGLRWVSKSSRPSVDTFMSAQASKTMIVNGLYTKGMGASETTTQMGIAKLRDSDVYTDYLTWYASQMWPYLTIPHLLIDSPSVPGDFQGTSYQLNLDDVKRWADESLQVPASVSDWSNWSYENALSGKSGANLDTAKISALYLNQKRNLSFRRVFSGLYNPAYSDFKNRASMALTSFKNNLIGIATIRYGKQDEWNTRAPASSHFSEQNTLFESLFSDLNWLISQMASDGLSDNIVLVVRSNLGKNPRLNSLNGKNPWPYTSLLLWSKLWTGGRVIGQFDSHFVGVPMDPIFGSAGTSYKTYLTADHIFAAIFSRLLLSPSGFWLNPEPAMVLFQETTP